MKSITVSSVMGAFVVLAGMAYAERKVALAQKAKKRAGHGRSNLLVYGAACCIAGYHVYYDRAFVAGARPMELFVTFLSIGSAIYFALFGRACGAHAALALHAFEPVVCLAGLACSCSFVLFLLGLQGAGPAAAITIRNCSVIFVQFFALALGGSMNLVHLLGAGLVFVGAALVA